MYRPPFPIMLFQGQESQRPVVLMLDLERLPLDQKSLYRVWKEVLFVFHTLWQYIIGSGNKIAPNVTSLGCLAEIFAGLFGKKMNSWALWCRRRAAESEKAPEPEWIPACGQRPQTAAIGCQVQMHNDTSKLKGFRHPMCGSNLLSPKAVAPIKI